MRSSPGSRRPLRVLPFVLLACAALGACDLTGEDTGDGGSDGGDPPGAAGEAYLTAHNAVRTQATPTPSPALEPLTWFAQAEQVAQVWANNCRFEHNPGRGNLGENLYASSSESTPAKVVQAWAAEAPSYDYAGNRCASGAVCGHYTQLVWRATKQVGCASARCTRNSPLPGFSTWYLYVCDYAPPGNFVGQRPY